MKYLTPEEALRLYEKWGSIRRAARESGIPRTTFRRRLAAARQAKEGTSTSQYHSMLRQISNLKKELRQAKEYRLTTKEVRKYIIGLNDHTVKVEPKWLSSYHDGVDVLAGVPSIMLSDFHWSEVVDPAQVFNRNEYNMDIAAERLEKVVVRSINILKEGLAGNTYPGIVVNLAGDMISGDIHDELTVTNDRPVMPTFIDLYSRLIGALTRYADEFGNVFVACVNGNHSRTTKKIPAKDRAYTNFDWLLYNMLAKYFENDDRVSFLIADGGDLQYKVYSHVYRLTHGDQFRGGYGFLGLAAPVIRGEIKKRNASITYNYSYDTLLIGHFHQYMTLGKAIVNGSLVGYNEYAMLNNFPYEVPRQALWLTNKVYGITAQIPVIAIDMPEHESVDWVAIPK